MTAVDSSARDRAIKTPPFGATIVSTYASSDNPHKTGMFVRVLRRPRARMNPGTWWQITDGRGGFWELKPDMCEIVPGAEVLRALAEVAAPDTPADSVRLVPAGEVERRRAELCEALAIPRDLPWIEALANARSAGVVRDAEYRALDRVEDENKQLRAELEEYRKRVTMGGPTVPVDTEWANATLPPPASASDETAPPIRTARGSHRLTDSR